MLKQNSFSRSLINDAKAGAYYTDKGHCERIGQLFSWPEEEVSILEPSIGDGSAVMAVTKNCNNATIFGVELNTSTYEKIKENSELDYVLNEDFLTGIKVSHKSFSFCFANPPYGMDGDNKKRLEQLFVEKLFSYLKNEAMFALVIPYYVLTDEKFLKSYLARFAPIATFRFDEDVYESFKQVVVIGQRRRMVGVMKPWFERYYQTIDALEKLPFLPQMNEVTDKIPVLPSTSADIEYFTTLCFNAVDAGKGLIKSSLYSVIGKHFPETYVSTDLGRPPTPLKKDLLYLCSIAGGGQGLVGSEENGDLHLQRGVVSVEESQEIVSNRDGEKGELIETSFTKISLQIIENDGTITTLT